MHQPEKPDLNLKPLLQGTLDVAGMALDKARALIRQKGVLRIGQASGFALIWLAIALFALSSCSKAEAPVKAFNYAVPQVAPVQAREPFVQFAVPAGTCPANNGFMTLQGTNIISPTPASFFYPRFSADNPSPVDITVGAISTRETDLRANLSEKDFGEQGYASGTPWDMTNTSAFLLTDTVGTPFSSTVSVTFSTPVYGLKFLVSDLNRVSETVEIRVYDENGVLIPAGSILQRDQALFMLNEPINSHSFTTSFVTALGVGVGGGYLYSGTVDSPGGDDNTAIYVQISSLQAASRFEINFGSLDTGALVLSAPYFNLACLLKSFNPPAIYLTETSVMSIEVINSFSEPMRSDIDFTDLLTPGILLAGTPGTPQCGADVASPISTTLVVTGVAFNLGDIFCDITANVSGTLPGTYLNVSSNFTAVANLDPSGANGVLEVLPPEILGDPISGTYGYSYTFQFGTIGFPGTPVFTASANLPPGIMILPTGELTGTGLAAGIYPSITITAGDGVVTATKLVTVEIVPAPLTIVADDKQVIWNHPFPTFTAHFYGLLLDDTPADFTLMFTTTAVVGSPVGSYPIFVTSNDDPNYIETYVPGVLTIRYETTPGLKDVTFEHKHHKPICPPMMMQPMKSKHNKARPMNWQYYRHSEEKSWPND